MPVYDLIPWHCDRVYPGGVIYLWSPTNKLINGALPPLPGPGWSWFQPSRSISGLFMQLFVIGVHVDPAAAPGVYVISWTDLFGVVHNQNVNVVAPPAVVPAVVAGGGGAAIQASINALNNYIRLTPGEYLIPNMLTFPAGSGPVTIDGGGYATLTRVNEPAVYQNKFFDTTEDLNLTGLTFKGHQFDTGDLVLHPSVLNPINTTVTGCRFIGCQLGQEWYLTDGVVGGWALIEDCEFINAGSGPIPSGIIFFRCTWREGTYHPIFNRGAASWLVVTCDWIRTARGIVCQTGPVSNGVIAGNRFWDIAHGQDNAGEVILFEAPNQTGMTNNVFLNSQMYGCSGPGVSLSGGGMNNNTFQDLTLHTQVFSIIVNGFSGKIYNNRFGVVEMGAGLSLLGDCQDNTFDDIIGLWNPIRNGNQNAALFNYSTLPIFSDASVLTPGHPNVFTNCRISYPVPPLTLPTDPIPFIPAPPVEVPIGGPRPQPSWGDIENVRFLQTIYDKLS